MTSICLYLPNVAKKYKYNDIKFLFKKYKFGIINYINIVNTEFTYNRVFIDFKIWFKNERNDKLKKFWKKMIHLNYFILNLIIGIVTKLNLV